MSDIFDHLGKIVILWLIVVLSIIGFGIWVIIKLLAHFGII